MTSNPRRAQQVTRPGQEPTAKRRTLTRAEERLAPDVRQVEAGRVIIRRRTIEEESEVTVQLRHDELELERVPADRPLGADELPVTERGEETVVLVVEERLQVSKVPWVVEEIHLRRNLRTAEQTVADTVRKERITIDSEGEVRLRQEP